MALAINSNFAAIAGGALTAMKSNQGLMGKSITRISTGSKLSTNDNASALISANKIKADADGYRALYSGIQSGSAKLNAASTAANSMLDILSSMKSKAIDYSATSDDSAKAAIQSEFAALQSAYQAASKTRYEGGTIWGNVSFTLGLEGGSALSEIEISKYGTVTAKSGTGVFSMNGQVFQISSDTSNGIIAKNSNGETIGKLNSSKDKIELNALGLAELNGGSYYGLTIDSSSGIVTSGGAGNAKNNVVINGANYTVNANSNGSGTILVGSTQVGSWERSGTSLNIALYSTGATTYTATVATPADATSYSVIEGASTFQQRIDALTSQIANMNAGSTALSKISDYMQNMAAAQDAAYETIADADMAAEMTQYVKRNVLSQAAQAMISQANQSMAQVLNLLQ